MANTDLRYQRTERRLLQAFGEAMEEKPLDKITVTALSAAAEINKATFYLHYRDIYELAAAYARAIAAQRVGAMDYLSCFFEDPRTFAARLVADFEARKDEAVRFEENGLMRFYLDAFADALHAHLRKLKPVVDDGRSAMMIMFVLHGTLSLLPRYGNDTQAAADVAGEALTALNCYGEARHAGRSA